MKSESDGRQGVWKKQVAFMDKNHLAAAGFYYTNSSGVVCCALELGHWQETTHSKTTSAGVRLVGSLTLQRGGI